MGEHREKAERITSIRNSLDSVEELERRLPEVTLIEDDEIREKTIQCFIKACPDAFWERPTTSTGKYHPEDERGVYGNWLHTKRVFIQYANLSETDVEMGTLTEWERDCGKSAALLHDMMKYGWPSNNNEHTVSEHDIIAAEVARELGGLPDEVYNMIHAHMGPWGSGKEPETHNEILLHRADKAVSPDWSTIGVYEPSDELIEELNVVGYDDNGRVIE